MNVSEGPHNVHIFGTPMRQASAAVHAVTDRTCNMRDHQTQYLHGRHQVFTRDEARAFLVKVLEGSDHVLFSIQLAEVNRSRQKLLVVDLWFTFTHQIGPRTIALTALTAHRPEPLP